MSEIVHPARTVLINYQCDACKIGWMLPYGKSSYLSDPIQIPHKCDHCGIRMNFRFKYPYSKIIADAEATSAFADNPHLT